MGSGEILIATGCDESLLWVGNGQRVATEKKTFFARLQVMLERDAVDPGSLAKIRN